MGEYPSYDSAQKLIRDLRKQDFVIEETSDGFLVTSPLNSETTIIHEGSGSYSNAKLADLKRMGFQPPGLRYPCNLCEQRFASTAAMNSHRGSAHGMTWPCPLCGEAFHNPQAMGKHRARVHGTSPKIKSESEPRVVSGEELAAQLAQAESEEHELEPKTRKRRGVTIRNVEEIEVIVQAGQDLQDAAARMIDAYKELYRRYADQKRRLAKIEDYIGKAVQSL